MVGGATNGRRAGDDSVPERLMTEDRPFEPYDDAHPAPPVPRGMGVPFDTAIEELRRRRLEMERVAVAAEEAAADAASMAAAAIGAASRAAEAAEAAADRAARAAEAAEEAAAAEQEAIAQAQAQAGARHAHGAPPRPRPSSDRGGDRAGERGGDRAGERPRERREPRRETATDVQTDAIAAVRPDAAPRTGDRERGDRERGDRERGELQGEHPAAEPVPSPRPDPTADGPATIRMPIAAAAPGSAASSRAARRRAQEAAAASAREANRDPVTERLAIQKAEPTELIKTAEPEPEEELVEPELVEQDDDDDDEPIKRRIPVALVAAGVVAMITVAAVAAILMGRGGNEQPVEPEAGPTPQSQSAPDVAPTGAEKPKVDPSSRKAVAFLDALRQSSVPVSRSGLVETEAAATICDQLDQGTAEADVAKTLPAVLPSVNKKQSPQVVTAAKRFYC